jgi:SseB protein N-terminal domain
MSQDPQPNNDLERKLLDAQEGRIEPQELIDALMAGEVFMPVYEKHQIAGFGASTKAKPLTLKDQDSGEEVLVLFTSPERAKEFVRDYPGYGGGLVTELPWILERLGVGYGITLNPGQELGMELEARALQQLVAGRH